MSSPTIPDDVRERAARTLEIAIDRPARDHERYVDYIREASDAVIAVLSDAGLLRTPGTGTATVTLSREEWERTVIGSLNHYAAWCMASGDPRHAAWAEAVIATATNITEQIGASGE